MRHGPGLLLLLAAAALPAQIQIINPSDLISQAPTKLNGNFAYLDSVKAGTNRANTYGAFLQRFDAALMRLPERIVATLPPASLSTNDVFVVTNGLTSSDCTVGGGTARALCISNASAWVALGGGGGGGGTPGGSNTQCQYNNAGAFGGVSGCTTDGVNLALTAPNIGNATGTSLVLGTPIAVTPGTGGVPFACGEGTAPSVGAASGIDIAYCDSALHAVKLSVNGGSYYRITQTVAVGTATLATASITNGNCATVVTVSATGVLSTDVVDFAPNASLKAVTGYTPGGGLSIRQYPTANNVNFEVCNETASPITPGSAVTLNWAVRR